LKVPWRTAAAARRSAAAAIVEAPSLAAIVEAPSLIVEVKADQPLRRRLFGLVEPNLELGPSAHRRRLLREQPVSPCCA
jgi:hypothetical protein